MIQNIQERISDAIHPRHFYVGNGLELVWRPMVEEVVSWEIFRGRLLDPAHTRQSRHFLSWNIHQLDGERFSEVPILSVKWDSEADKLHVVRAILSHVWEGYDSGKDVIETRAVIKWVRELVGTVDVQSATVLPGLIDAAICGTSRLPLTSLEAPLPAHSLGQLAYLHDWRPDAERPFASWREIVAASPHSWSADRIALEAVFRAARSDELRETARSFSGSTSIASEFLDLFQNVSLSPYTCLVDNVLAFLDEAVRSGTVDAVEQVRFLTRLLILLHRHLTAYDLVTYHHRGANYPDALLLDAALGALLDVLERQPALAGAAERAALRQACLLRRHYEEWPVPDAPTSPGENARVLPPPHVRVPEEQMNDLGKRTKHLYAGDPLPPKLGPVVCQLLRTSVDDLLADKSWREMGQALFVDRPLGWDLPAGAPETTPLISHKTFSPSIARRRLAELLTLLTELRQEVDPATLNALERRGEVPTTVAGVPIGLVASPSRPCVSLADAARVASDFVVIRTNMPEALRTWLCEKLPADCHLDMGRVVLARVRQGSGSALAVFDGRSRFALACTIS